MGRAWHPVRLPEPHRPGWGSCCFVLTWVQFRSGLSNSVGIELGLVICFLGNLEPSLFQLADWCLGGRRCRSGHRKEERQTAKTIHRETSAAAGTNDHTDPTTQGAFSLSPHKDPETLRIASRTLSIFFMRQRSNQKNVNAHGTGSSLREAFPGSSAPAKEAFSSPRLSVLQEVTEELRVGLQVWPSSPTRLLVMKEGLCFLGSCLQAVQDSLPRPLPRGKEKKLFSGHLKLNLIRGYHSRRTEGPAVTQKE